MIEPERINPMEVPLIAEIERNETWLLGEKVGHAVNPKCNEVQSKVVEIVLNSGSEWRTHLDHGTVSKPHASPPINHSP